MNYISTGIDYPNDLLVVKRNNSGFRFKQYRETVAGVFCQSLSIYGMTNESLCLYSEVYSKSRYFSCQPGINHFSGDTQFLGNLRQVVAGVKGTGTEFLVL